MRISDWSSDVCSSDLTDRQRIAIGPGQLRHVLEVHAVNRGDEGRRQEGDGGDREDLDDGILLDGHHAEGCVEQEGDHLGEEAHVVVQRAGVAPQGLHPGADFGIALDRKSTRLNSSNAHLVCRFLLAKTIKKPTKDNKKYK